jgi:hypothetical protein
MMHVNWLTFLHVRGEKTAAIILTIFDIIQNELTCETNCPVFVHPWTTPWLLLAFSLRSINFWRNVK